MLCLVHTYNLSPLEAKVGRFGFQGQPGLCSPCCKQNKQTDKQTKNQNQNQMSHFLKGQRNYPGVIHLGYKGIHKSNKGRGGIWPKGPWRKVLVPGLGREGVLWHHSKAPSWSCWYQANISKSNVKAYQGFCMQLLSDSVSFDVYLCSKNRWILNILMSFLAWTLNSRTKAKSNLLTTLQHPALAFVFVSTQLSDQIHSPELPCLSCFRLHLKVQVIDYCFLQGAGCTHVEECHTMHLLSWWGSENTPNCDTCYTSVSQNFCILVSQLSPPPPSISWKLKPCFHRAKNYLPFCLANGHKEVLWATVVKLVIMPALGKLRQEDMKI